MRVHIFRLFAVPLAAFGLAVAHTSHALEEPAGKESAAKIANTSPVVRTIKFQSDETITFKQRLEIYNRAKAADEKLHCREDRMTGSHRKKMRCITMANKQLEEDAARAFFRALR